MFTYNLKIYFNHLLNNSFIFYIVLAIFILMTVSISSCFAGPNRSIAISGNVELSIDDEDNLCFEPLFATTMESNTPVEIEYLKMKRLSLKDYNVPDDQSRTILTLVPVNNEYHIIKNGEKICLNTDNPNLQQTIFKPLQPQPVVVLIAGLDEKETIFVNFHHNFNYPYVPE